MPRKLDPKQVYERFLECLEDSLGRGTTLSGSLDYIGGELFGSRWAGIFMRDEDYPIDQYCIVNTDKKGQPGTHWVAVGGGMQYDSFGRKNILGNGRLRDTEPKPEQTPDETDCGARCMAWLCTLNLLGADKARLI